MKPRFAPFSISVPPGAAGAREARLALQAAMAETDMAKDSRDGLLLSAAEWITNLGEHPCRPPSRAHVTLSRVGGTFLFGITDDGSAFDDFEKILPAKDVPPALKEAGLGIAIMARQFTTLTYVTDAASNRLRIQSHAMADRDKATILLVDDDPTVRNLYVEYLKAKYRILLADSAHEALQILRRNAVDLVISDIQMPNGESGLDLCAHVRSNSDTATVPFIFLTGRKDDQTREAALGLAIDDYLLKPIRKAVLVRCAERVLRNARFIHGRLSDKFDENLTSLLQPSLPAQMGNFRSAVGWQEAEAGGGDLLFHRCSGSENLIVMADLMGHGSQAKFFSHALSGFLSGMMAGLDFPSPGTLLQRLNTAFAEQPILNATIATAIALTLLPDGRVIMAAAGHPGPFLMDERGLAPVAVSGSLLGMAGDSLFKEQSFQLKVGQRVCLFTDGLIEIGETTDQRHRNFLHIQSLLTESNAMPLREAADFLKRRALALAGDTLRDDITFAFVEYAPPG